MEKIMGGRRWPTARRYRWGFMGLIAVAGLATWLAWGHQAPPPPPKPAPVAEAPSHMEVLSLTEIQDGDKRWVLEGQKANFLKDRDEVSISGVKMEFFGSPGQHFLVKGEEGLLNTKTRVLTLKGHVEMRSGDLSMKTDAIIYHPTERVLEAQDEVTLEGPTVRVQGKGLRVELAQKRMTLAQHRLTEIKTQGMALK